jgi:hypothetical protein
MLIASRPTSSHSRPGYACRRSPRRSVLAARPRPRFCSRTQRLPASRKQRGRRSAERRIRPMSAPRHQMLPPECARARCPHPTLPRTRGRAGRGLASRRSAAALAKATERFGSAQAALHAKERAPALPAPSIALKRSTPHPGRSAGGDDAQAARGLRIASKFRQFIIIYQLYDG